MENIKESKTFKIICYTLVPILVLIIILNIFSLMYYSENKEDISQYQNYLDTQQFAENYLYNIRRAIRIAENEHDLIIEGQTEEQTQNTEIILDNIQYNFYTMEKYDVLLISKEGNIVTNVKRTIDTDSKEEIQNYILSKKCYWKYDGTNIETDISKLSYNEMVYNDLELIKNNEYEIYIALNVDIEEEYYVNNLIHNFVRNTYKSAPSVIAVSSILLMSVGIYIVWSIGHKKEKEGIYTNTLDKIPYEILVILIGFILFAEACVLSIFISFVGENSTKFIIDNGIIISILIGFIIYLTLAIFGITTIRRLKAHIFIKNTLCYKIFKYAIGGLFLNFNETLKLGLEYIIFIWVSVVIIILAMTNTPIMFLVLLGFWYYVFKQILNYKNQLKTLREKIKNMYNGDISSELNKEELHGELKQVAEELNDISGGISNAIEKATKSERLKTELITNVSHDIKTPLTSIINYVDLMKKENIENEKVQEYLNILDSKSQRLKKLTEDLIEASKASSGNIKLTMEKLNVKELMKQVGGEFEDRFKKKGLEIIENYPENEVYIQADSRHMYRIMENIYVNISKYALENSRVYIDIIKKNEKVQIILKNISKEKLNISVDELMARFVRGDKSRTTEGSGLGISIAKSLTELQQGKFDICLDGDLFKVIIEF